MNDTWEWDGESWTQVSSTGPEKRWGSPMAYDAARGEMVLFGGRGVSSNLGDTWILRSPVLAAASDYDRDGASDLVVYDPRTKRWRVKGGSRFKFGGTNAIPVPGDYDGDGKADAAYFQAADGIWRVRKQFEVTDFGQNGDIPAPLDFDGDGSTDLAFFRPSTGIWHILVSADVQAAAAATRRGVPFSSRLDTQEVEFGQLGDVPVPGDYDGDGIDDLAIYRASKRLWIIRDQNSVRFGKSGSIPVPGDYDGDGGADFAVFDPVTGLWSVRGQFEVQHGKPGEIPLVRGR